VTFYKDVIGFFATDGTNGQRIMNYSHQDKPLQIGGDVLAATGHSLGSEDVLIGGANFEVDAVAYFDAGITVTGLTTTGNIEFTSWSGYGGFTQKADDGLHFVIGDGDGTGNRHLIFVDQAVRYSHCDHDTQSTNPTIFLHSALNPDTSNNQWGSFAHDQEDFVITTGDNTGAGTAPTTDENGIKLFPRSGSAGLHVKGLGELHATRAAITVGSGAGITVNVTGDLNRQLYKVTTTYAAYTDADTTKGIVIATLPAKMKIVGFYADTTAAYTGGATNAATMVVGITAESAAEIIA